MIDAENKKIVDEVLEYFAVIAAIPRPSLHEKAVSDFLLGAFSVLGCDVRQDAANNIIADRAASPGFESAPRVILQSHMDMVCVAAEGVEYDPLRDPIRLCRTEEDLIAEGTSLGADDGAGIAMILYVFRHAKNVGALRAIITTDEETGMTGAQSLDGEELSDADYLINWDSEKYDELTRGCAGSVGIELYRDVDWHIMISQRAWRVSVRGLMGGHSGERIGDGRGNAIQMLGRVFCTLRNAEIPFNIASLTGGSARNAIAAGAEAIFTSPAEEVALRRILLDLEKRQQRIFNVVEPGISIVLKEAETPKYVMTNQDAEAIIDALSLLHSGVFKMSPNIPGLVETSANLGLLRTEGNKVRLSYFARSSIDEQLEELVDNCQVIAKRLKLKVQIATPSPGWRERPQSALADIMAEIFERQNGRPMKISVIHAGLECGWHIKKAPHLDMVSIGVTTHNIHSPKETLKLATIAPQVRLVMKTLHTISKMK